MTVRKYRPRGTTVLPISCQDCYAWGTLPGRHCLACSAFRSTYPLTGDCTGCRRTMPLKQDYCRLCWCQARADAKDSSSRSKLGPYLENIRCHQLFFARLQRQRARDGQPKIGRTGRKQTKPRPGPDQTSMIPDWTQPPLFDCRRDFTAFDLSRHADPTNPWLIHAQREAHRWGQARGWPDPVLRQVDRALVIVLSASAGEKVRYSDIFCALHRRGIGVLHPAEILDHCGLLDDDRPAQFNLWLQRKLAEVAPGIQHDVEGWMRTLHDGGPRTQPRKIETLWNYLNTIRPVLIEWSARYDHLREVTRDDIVMVTDSAGRQRHDRLKALRSLFRHCKKTGAIFRDPTVRLRVGSPEYRAIIPLQPNEIAQTLAAAATPVARLAVALAGVHAASTQAICHMRLEDIDLGNRRLIIGDRIHPLDDLTHHLLTAWLDHRRRHWPNTANPHLIINKHTALDHRPPTPEWLTQCLRGQTATLRRLRIDRQLEEALTHGPDALHLAAVFGLNDKTALRYADAARQILETEAERHAIASSLEPEGLSTLNDHDGPLGSR